MFYGSKKCIFLDIIKLVLPIILIKPHRSEPLHGAPEARQEDCYSFQERFFWLFFLPLSAGTLATHSCGKLPSCTRRNHFGTPRQELGSCDMKHSETLGSPSIPNSTDVLLRATSQALVAPTASASAASSSRRRSLTSSSIAHPTWLCLRSHHFQIKTSHATRRQRDIWYQGGFWNVQHRGDRPTPLNPFPVCPEVTHWQRLQLMTHEPEP